MKVERKCNTNLIKFYWGSMQQIWNSGSIESGEGSAVSLDYIMRGYYSDYCRRFA